MADFFLSIPGLIACGGIGTLILIARPRRNVAASQAGAGGDQLRQAMQVVVSLAVLAAGLWVILSARYGADAERWAAGAIGTVVGYWLKP